MKFSYDPRYNVAYIRFKKKTDRLETLRISDELNIDLTPDGKVYGIELLNANVQLQYEDVGRLSIINEATGEKSELQLSF